MIKPINNILDKMGLKDNRRLQAKILILIGGFFLAYPSILTPSISKYDSFVILSLLEMFEKITGVMKRMVPPKENFFIIFL